MSVEENKKIAQKFYDAIAAKQYDEVEKLCHKDFVYYPQVDIVLSGAKSFVDLERLNMDPFGDFKMEVEFMIGESDRVAVYLIVEGDLQTDKYHGMVVTNKHLRMGFMTWLQFKDGKIIEKRAKYDRFYIYKQLGIKELSLQ